LKKTTVKEKIAILTCTTIGIPYIIDVILNNELSTHGITSIILAILTVLYTLLGGGDNGEDREQKQSRETLYNSETAGVTSTSIHNGYNNHRLASEQSLTDASTYSEQSNNAGTNIKYATTPKQLTDTEQGERDFMLLSSVSKTPQSNGYADFENAHLHEIGKQHNSDVATDTNENWRNFNSGRGSRFGLGANEKRTQERHNTIGGMGQDNIRDTEKQRLHSSRSEQEGGLDERTNSTDYCELCNSLTYSSSNSENVKFSVTEEERRLLANIIYWEARGESLQGQIAVGAVVLNRVNSDRFRENTIRDVIFAPNQFTPARTRNMNLPLYALSESVIMATDYALQGVDPTNGALFFNGIKIPSTKYIKTIGNHVFSR
jgi:hypothetical protein